MSRVKGGTVTHARHKKIIKAAKGYYGRRKSNFKVATQAVDKANQYATRDRKNRKRNFRALWIQRINAAVRSHDEALTYSLIDDCIDSLVFKKQVKKVDGERNKKLLIPSSGLEQISNNDQVS